MIRLGVGVAPSIATISALHNTPGDIYLYRNGNEIDATTLHTPYYEGVYALGNYTAIKGVSAITFNQNAYVSGSNCSVGANFASPLDLSLYSKLVIEGDFSSSGDGKVFVVRFAAIDTNDVPASEENVLAKNYIGLNGSAQLEIDLSLNNETGLYLFLSALSIRLTGGAVFDKQHGVVTQISLTGSAGDFITDIKSVFFSQSLK